MPVPTLISELSTSAGSNYPGGGESPITADDYFRAHAAFIAQLRDGQGASQEVALASATTTDIGGASSKFVSITGTTTITSFGTNYNGPRFLRFSGVLTLTHNATTLILPTAENITTAAGDTAIAIPISGGWYVYYQRADGQALTVLSPLLRNYHAGFTLSTAGSSTTMTIGSGQCADSTNANLIDLTASINKTTGAWVAGTGNGALDTGAIANSTWYHFYVIYNPTTLAVDILCSLSNTFTGATKPSGFTRGRWIGVWKTNGSGQWASYTQAGDDVFLDVASSSTISFTTSRAAQTVTDAPPLRCMLTLRTEKISVNYVLTSDGAAATPYATLVASTDLELTVRTNATGQVYVQGSGTSTCTSLPLRFNIAEAKGRNA